MRGDVVETRFVYVQPRLHLLAMEFQIRADVRHQLTSADPVACIDRQKNGMKGPTSINYQIGQKLHDVQHALQQANASWKTRALE